MPFAAAAIMVFICVLLSLFGVLIKYYKCYWLISGYNTASQEKKRNIDIEGLGKFMGNLCFLIAGVLLIGSILNYLGFFYGFIIAMASLFLIITIALFRAQKYDYNTQTPIGKTKKSVILIVSLVLLVIFLIPTGIIYYGVQEPEVTIITNALTISGIYGTSIQLEDITKIILVNEIPSIVRKTDGFDFGSILRGNFEIDNAGKVKLFVNMKKPPFLVIEAREKVIMNFNDGLQTEELYTKLKAIMNTF